ncbi:MAG: pseudouridine synthase [Phycisphaerales bacterium]
MPAPEHAPSNRPRQPSKSNASRKPTGPLAARSFGVPRGGGGGGAPARTGGAGGGKPPYSKPGFKKPGYGPPASQGPRQGMGARQPRPYQSQGAMQGGGGGYRGPGPGREDTRLPTSVRVIHDDMDLIVVDKPAGLLTANLPDEDRPALFDMLKASARARARWVKPVRPTGPGARGPNLNADGREVASRGPGRRALQKVFIIHRLDKEASGLLVFALSERAFTWLKDDFKAKRVHRIYHAILEGEMGKVGDAGTIQSFLRELPTGKVESIKPEQFRGAAGDDSDAKPAVTHFRVVAVGEGRTLVQVRLETGRKNQIRAHMAERGHPLVGDARFGAKSDPLGRLCLHASELGFTHPGNGQTVRFRSAPPPEFFRLVGMKPPIAVASDTVAPPSPASSPPLPSPPSPALTPPTAPTAKGATKATAPGTSTRAAKAIDTSWNEVAGWYDSMLSPEQINDHYRDVIIPGTVRLAQPREGERVLDVACGQGIISRALAELGASVVGTDSAAALIGAARARAGAKAEYHTLDARALDTLPGLVPSAALASFDLATCVMALTNIDPLEPVFRGVAALLKPRGRFVAVFSHPAFRAPQQTGWGWDAKTSTQYRRVDGYLSTGQHAIEMHPGKASAGAPGGEAITWTFHRPIQHYARLLGESGLLIETIEEWPGKRESQPGPKADAENRARREIPLFIAIRAIRAG